MAILYKKPEEDPKKDPSLDPATTTLSDQTVENVKADVMKGGQDYYKSDMFAKKFKSMWGKEATFLTTLQKNYLSMPKNLTDNISKESIPESIEMANKYSKQFPAFMQENFGSATGYSSKIARKVPDEAGRSRYVPAQLSEFNTPETWSYRKDQSGNPYSLSEYQAMMRHEEGHVGTDVIPFTNDLKTKVMSSQKATADPYLQGKDAKGNIDQGTGFSEVRSDMFSVITDPSIHDIYNGNREEMTVDKLIQLKTKLKDNLPFQRLLRSYEDKDLMWIFNNLAKNKQSAPVDSNAQWLQQDIQGQNNRTAMARFGIKLK